jgi:hypothetical protein
MQKVWIFLLVLILLAAGGFLFSGHFQHKYVETFSSPLVPVSGAAFGPQNQFTFSMGAHGTFVIDGKSGLAWEKSDSYRDSAFIRSTHALPKTYKISAVVGDIDYGLEKIDGLDSDPDFPEGPQNENGCYLLTITDTRPDAPHTNIWWHQHRKLVIDVDNNVWGHGMPNPIFMVYFDKGNSLTAYDGNQNTWAKAWEKAVTYREKTFYKVEVEKTADEFILRIFSQEGRLLKEGRVGLDKVWHEDAYHEDYFAIGDPHANYYQGSMKIKQITLED